MTRFRTEINPPAAPFSLHHQRSLLSIGSCFATHMGQKLKDRKFSIVRNPFGIIYNPVSIAQNLLRMLHDEPYLAQDLFQYQQRWYSFDHHGHFALPDAEATLQKINTSWQNAKSQLAKPTTLLLTLGTATAFKHLERDRIVANCHKLPANQFQRFRLDLDLIVDSLATAFAALKKHQPDLQCIITLSPVRHLKDGLIENQKSKATLLLAMEQIGQQFDWVHYFPAYEIQLDDLRDYRFYESDLLHPNDAAINYIWERFSRTYFSEDTQAINRRVEKIHAAAGHRPFHPELEQHQQFLQKQLANIEQLEREFPFLDFAEERAAFVGQRLG